MIGGLTKGDKAAEAGKTSNQLREVLVAEHVVNAINDLQKLHDRLCSPQGNNCVNDIRKFAQDGGGLCEFRLLQSYINYVEEDEPSIEKLTIMKFLRSIIEDEELYVKLHNFNYLHPDFDGIPGSIDYEEIRSQLSRIVTDCKLENLEDKIRLLVLLREKMNFADIQKAYDNWRFSDPVGDNDFKRMYVDQAVKEREKPVSEYFEENIGKYIKLVEEGKEITSRYFGKWKVNFQAYCEEINNNRVLNVNLINYNRSEPTRISDILQQEKDIKKLNIYCNKKHEIYAYQEDKKRYYEFKECACYEMTSTWPVENGSRMCTMIMNVSSDGITEILKFDGEDFVPSEEILELIKQNDELYIQGLSLHDAVMKSLEKGKAADVVPTANNNLQNEFIRINQDKEPGGNLKLECDADNSSPPFSINSNVSTQTEVNLQQIATQTEVDSQQAETGTQTEINSQQTTTETQAEINSQQTETQTEVNLQQIATQTEIDLQHTGTQTEVASQHIGIQTEINSQQITDLQNELGRAKQTIVELKKQNGDLQSESEKAKQTIEKLERQNSDLQDRFGKEEQKNTELQTELAQKDEELAELRGKVESMCEEKRKLSQELKIVNAEKEELKSELKELKKELRQVQEENSNLEDKFDHLEHLNKKMDGNQEQLSEQVLDLQKGLSCSEKVTQELINKLKSAEAEKKEVNQKLAEAGQRIEALKKQTSDSQDKLEKKERGSKIEMNEIRKELTQLKENLERNEEELKSVYEEKRKLEDKLKGVNTEKKESEDKLKEFKKEIDQAAHIMKEKEQSISNLKYQMLGLKNEYKAQLKSMDREHEDEVKELKENRDALSDIIAGKVLDIEGLMKKLQSSEKEKEFFRGQVEELSEETFADKQKSSSLLHLMLKLKTLDAFFKIQGFNNQFYTLTGDISSEPDNAPRKKIKLFRSVSFDNESGNEFYVPQNPQKKKKKLLRFSSFDSESGNESYVPQEGENDSAYDSNEENCDDDLSSNITTTSIEKVAESRNVGKALL